jgi:parallel beta-helix repeat protein
MKKILTILSLSLISFASSYAVLVDGYCYLQGQTIHSGTKVLFQADSPTAVTDSAYTAPSGYYQINVQPGLYDVTYSHQGYMNYNLDNQMLMIQTTLPEVILDPGIPISGVINGVLSNNLYIVVGDLYVNPHDSLIIEPGAIILFAGAYFFTVGGSLYAIGTETDSIIFAACEGAPHWRGIDFIPPTEEYCRLKYCVITESNYAGISVSGGNALIENCSIVDNYNLLYGGGTGTGGSLEPVFRNCLISGNSSDKGGGFYSSGQSHPILDNCIIKNNIVTAHGAAACFVDNSNAEFQHCIISSNGPKGGIYIEDTAHPTFINCTIDSNWDTGADGYGIKLAENSYITVENTIVSNNSTVGIACGGTAGAQCDITYSDFHNDRNFSGTLPNLLGQNMLVNNNGDSCDLFFNIQLNPEYYSTIGDSAYYLTANSPCIDAGNPLSPLDPDGTIADMGAYPFNHIPLLTINIMGDDAILNWQSIGSAEEYRIYYSSNPYFTPTGVPQAVVLPPDTSWTDENALNVEKRFYRIVVQY